MGFLTMLHGTMVTSGGGNGGSQVLGGSPSDTGTTFVPPSGVYMYIDNTNQPANKMEFYVDANPYLAGSVLHDPNANQAPALEVAKRIIGYALNADYNNVQLGVEYDVQDTDEVIAFWYPSSQPVIINAWLSPGSTVKLSSTINSSVGMAYKIEFSNVPERQSDYAVNNLQLITSNQSGIQFGSTVRLSKRIAYGHDYQIRTQTTPNIETLVFSDHASTGSSYEFLWGAVNQGPVTGSEVENYLKGLAAWVTNQDVSNINLDTAYNIDSSVGDLALIRDDYIVEPDTGSSNFSPPSPYTSLDVDQNWTTNIILGTTSSSTIKIVSSPWLNNHPIFGGSNFYLLAPDQRLSIEFTNISILQTNSSGFSYERLQDYPLGAGDQLGRYYWAKSV